MIRNRLAAEKSLYLRLHAENPVDWLPWGEEALQLARREDKLIFLSIGYSTCHWCHVMARESFADPDVARLMNDLFVAIKVDREERPDLDNLYMTVCQLLTGSGGWPLTIILTPDQEPVFAATYLPKESRAGRQGMLDLIPWLKELWQSRRGELRASGREIVAALRQLPSASPGDPVQSSIEAGMAALASRYDQRDGGFGPGPKFPLAANLFFLLRFWHRTRNEVALAMTESSLAAMRRGGIHDHLGGGFHRYATDAAWRLPHFEKMLYDQALLAIAYTEAYQATGRAIWAETAREILAYVERDLRGPEGGFCAAEDAESGGEEGKFYLWRLEEIRDFLSPEEVELAVAVYDLRPEGNFSVEADGRRTGDNVLFCPADDVVMAARLGITETELAHRLEVIRTKMSVRRRSRPRPRRDEKILTDWNGLMIAAFATAARVFDDDGYRRQARDVADFLLSSSRTKEDYRLLHAFQDGAAFITGHLDDYAFLLWGLVELYEATFRPHYLREALQIGRQLVAHFWDPETGGFFLTADDAEKLLVRPKEAYDGALPSGNAVALINFLRLGRLTGEPWLEEKAHDIARAFTGLAHDNPAAHIHLLTGIDLLLRPGQEIVVVGRRAGNDTQAMLAAINSGFRPNTVVLLRPTDEDPAEVDAAAPFASHFVAHDGRATAYPCRNRQCSLPVSDPRELMAALSPSRADS